MFKKTGLLLIVGLLAVTLATCAALSPPMSDTASGAGETSTEAASTATLSSESPATDDVSVAATEVSYSIVDTGQNHCYSDSSGIPCPTAVEAFYGQDAQYAGNQPSYTLSADGLTVYDNVTGLTWTQSPDLNGDGDINVDDKLTFAEAQTYADATLNPQDYGGYSDWRLPTIKELYSLMNFNGATGTQPYPYLDTIYFDFAFGDTSAGERDIDAQFATSTLYVGAVMNGAQAMFGVNFADGRIKGYGIGQTPRHPDGKPFYVLYVRGGDGYGLNKFVANGDGTITDQASGLTWQGVDSGETLNWAGALNYCESLDYAGYDDWRLPNAKELQSIVDYSRSPQTTNSAAIDPIFLVTEIESWYWSSTTHLDAGVRNAVYLAFGQAYGLPNGNLVDVHGAGAQRSDPKSGDPTNYADGRGSPGQADQVRIHNYARCVREGTTGEIYTGGEPDQRVTARPGGGQGQPGQGGPPSEAIDACADQSQGATCQFTSPHGQVTGTCHAPHQQLVCVPEGGPPGGRAAGGPTPNQ